MDYYMLLLLDCLHLKIQVQPGNIINVIVINVIIIFSIIITVSIAEIVSIKFIYFNFWS